MKFVYPDISMIFDTEDDRINTIIIENANLFCDVLNDIQRQISGMDGISVVSQKNVPSNMSKKVELLDRFVPFEINSKSLISKISTEIEKNALDGERYHDTVELLGRISEFLNQLTFDFNCDIVFQKMDIGSIIKACAPSILDEYQSLAEKLLDYFAMITEFIGEKLFITVNLRSYLSDAETELFMQSVRAHGYHLVMIESAERVKLSSEKRLIIDQDLCEIVC